MHRRSAVLVELSIFEASLTNTNAHVILKFKWMTRSAGLIIVILSKPWILVRNFIYFIHLIFSTCKYSAFYFSHTYTLPIPLLLQLLVSRMTHIMDIGYAGYSFVVVPFLDFIGRSPLLVDLVLFQCVCVEKKERL